MKTQRFLILFFITIALFVGYFQISIPMCLNDYAGCIGYPVTPTPPTPAPGRYRPLWPAVESWIAPAVAQSDPHILIVDMLLEFLCITITVPALYSWLKRWGDPDRAILGVGIFAIVNLAAYHLFFRGGGIPVEVALVCLALAFIDHSWLVFIPLVVIGAFNRETSLVIVALYAAYHWRPHWRQAVVLAVIWVVITAGLHIVLGPAEHQVGGLIGTFEYNLSTFADGGLSNLLFIPLFISVMLGYRRAPVVFKRFVWVCAVYALAIVTYGAWQESQRLVLPMLPLLIPMMLGAHSLMSSTVV